MADTARPDGPGVEALIARFDDDLDRIERVPGPTVDAARDAISTLAGIYGEALARIVDSLEPAVVRRLAADELVGHLLALHGVHPDPVDDRIRRVLADAAPRLGTGGRAELTGIDAGGVARIRVAASGCGAAATANAVAEAVLAEAPELSGVEPHVVQPVATISVGSLLRRPDGAPT
jgi:hypothetical protein